MAHDAMRLNPEAQPTTIPLDHKASNEGDGRMLVFNQNPQSGAEWIEGPWIDPTELP